jgi:curli biogenesis system outer membrane secretion channel CsgG
MTRRNRLGRLPGTAARLLLLAGAAALAACASDRTRSGGKSDVYIASGEDRIARCSDRIGAAAITEADTNAQALLSAGLPRSMAPLVRQLLMQTRCFAVLERGAAFAALEHEMRIREQQGQERNLQMAAMTAADYVLRAEIVFAEQTAGSKTALGAMFGNLLGGLGTESRTREALIVISAVDARSSEIIAAAFGRGTNESQGLGSVMLGGGLLALQGGWLDTPQAKPVAAALVDAWNQLLPRLLAAHKKSDGARPRPAAALSRPEPREPPVAPAEPVPPPPAPPSSAPAAAPGASAPAEPSPVTPAPPVVNRLPGA